MFALTVIGLLALGMTPRRPTRTAVVTVVTSEVAMAARDGSSAGGPLPVVAPITKPGYGLTTANGAGDLTQFEARLPSGERISVVVVEAVGEITFVSLPEVAPAVTYAIAPADERPGPEDSVMLDSMAVPLDDFGALPVFVGEGTPLTARDGALVGLFTVDDDGIAAIVTVAPPAPPPPSPPPVAPIPTVTPTSVPSTTVPSAAPPPTTVAVTDPATPTATATVGTG